LQLLRSEHLLIPESSKKFHQIFKYLRIRRPLEINMVLTIEPGCYFSMQLMDQYEVRQSRWVDLKTLAKYIPVGGVRIEDAVVVKEDGCENLTIAVREVEDVEAICSGRV
jgi:Xaa-Pro dipeptidase